jgi:hypothetical protein
VAYVILTGDPRANFTGNPPADANNINDVVFGMGGYLNALGENWAGGADATGSTDSTAAILAALSACPPGGAVTLPPYYLSAGSLLPAVYKTTSPLVMPPGTGLRSTVGTGWDTYAFGDCGAVIKPSASFSGTSVIDIPDAGSATTQGALIQGIGIDGSALPGTTDGIRSTGPVVQSAIQNIAISSVTGWGINLTQDSGATGSQYPYDWEVSHVRLHRCAGGGVSFGDHTDSTWLDVYALGCGSASGHGFYWPQCPANSHFIALRSEWTTLGDGFHFTGSWNTGTGSGGAEFTGCSTDRNTQNGLYADATGIAPLIFTGCTFRRDGRNGGSGGGGYAAVQLNAATVPVILNGITVYPGTDDDGTGTNSPQIGVVAANSRYLLIASGWIHAATTAISNAGGNTVFRQNPNLVQVTGTTGSPAISYGTSWGTDNGADFTAAGGGRIYSSSQTTPPVCAAGTNAGGTPPAPVVTKATDVAGQITFGTGTAPAAGDMVDVTFNRAYGTQPYIVLSAMNGATAALGPYVRSPASTGFSVGFDSAPAASQANTVYAVSWIVVG